MGYHPRQDIVGKRFGKLQVVRRLPGSKAVCKCDCGKVAVVGVGHLPNAKSCGCWRKKARRTHGYCKRPEYRTWEHMLQRCKNPKDTCYANYGDRGITVCERWRSFASFIADMGPKPAKNYTIERVDNNGNYEPSNCTWIPKGEQSRNKRTNRPLTHSGLTMAIDAWALYTGIPEATIRTRLHRGWTVEQALTLKPRKGKKP